jgi:hypothetical protein
MNGELMQLEPAGMRRIELTGVRLELDGELISEHVLGAIEEGRYERTEARQFRRVIEQGERIVELGGGIGYLSTLALKQGKVGSAEVCDAVRLWSNHAIATGHSWSITAVRRSTVLNKRGDKQCDSLVLKKPLFLIAFAVITMLLLVMASTYTVALDNIERIYISENKLLFDQSDNLIEGIIFESFVNEENQLRRCRDRENYCQRHLEARDFFFKRGKYKLKGGLDVARQWGANTVRLNLNQAALNPEEEFFSPDYVVEVTDAVSLARRDGFAVIVALFDARNKKMPNVLRSRNPVTPLDDRNTLEAARVLAKIFGGDTGIMIELLNEPWSPVRRNQGWQLWRDGGTPRRGRFAGKTFVGVNAVISAIRAENAQNVIIVQGLRASFKGYPGGVRDTLNRIAYSAHPFLGKGDEERLDWAGNFGSFAESHPFLISAWNNPARKGWCTALGLNKPQEFLDYLRDRRIGVVAYALDVPMKLLKDFRANVEITTEYGDTCAEGGAAGEIIKKYYLEN